MQRVWFSRISGLFFRFSRSFPALLAMRQASVLPGGGDCCCLPVSAAAWVIYLLFEASLKATGFKSEELPSVLSRWAVALVSFLPVAPVLQGAHAESLNLVFLAGALLCLVQGRYGLLVPVAALACLSRPVGVPLGATAGLWWFTCWVRSSRQSSMGTAFVRHLGQLVSALVVCACALVWPAIAWWVTGRVDAYTATETAWRGTIWR